MKASEETLSTAERLLASRVPSFIPGADQINASQRTSGEFSYAVDQRTWALGSSYAIDPNQKLKFEWSQTRVGRLSRFVRTRRPARRPPATHGSTCGRPATTSASEGGRHAVRLSPLSADRPGLPAGAGCAGWRRLRRDRPCQRAEDRRARRCNASTPAARSKWPAIRSWSRTCGRAARCATAFSFQVVNMDDERYIAYWTVRRHVGKGVPPREYVNSLELSEHVRLTPRRCRLHPGR